MNECGSGVLLKYIMNVNVSKGTTFQQLDLNLLMRLKDKKEVETEGGRC